MWTSNKIKRNLFQMSITDGKPQIKIVINFYANKPKAAGLHRKRGIARTTIQRPFLPSWAGKRQVILDDYIPDDIWHGLVF